MGPRPPKAPLKAPVRPVVVERRDLAPATIKRKPKPDAAAELQAIADTMTHLPRDCIGDWPEMLVLMRRLARRIVVVAESGLDVVPSHRAQNPRTPLLGAPRPDAKAVAEAVFKPGRRARDEITTVTSRKGRRIPVVRRAEAAGQMRLI